MNRLLLLLIFPAIVIGQSANENVPVHLREIPRHNLSIDLGIAEPTGDYQDISRSGLSVGLTYDYYLNKNVGLSIGARHTYNETAFATAYDVDNTSLSSLSAGIAGSKTFNRFQVDAYARFGIGYLNTNSQDAVSQNNQQNYSPNNDAIKEFPLVLETGLRFNYYFRRSVQLYFAPQYHGSLGDALAYDNRRDIFFSNDPVFQTGLQPSFDVSNLIFSVGIKFALNAQYTRGELRDDSEPDN
ncbi:hypothetical protein [Nonlabens agnitus]|uniref:Outer membrane protein beta-barrel domain-containing protein n=1 Tax=Nonlabens agnitus TaxID=870484 RepID=A0A2S9WSW7_9FLAO|nr:hypothetical protein [Nonlabens agnitus]PRP66581.1 hypothetical protein BST86_05435 [Nonlabens agnitus]